MSVNSTSCNDSCLHPHSSSADSLLSFELYCFISTPGCFIFTTSTFIFIILLLPLCILVSYHGLQQWRKQRFSTVATHTDICTYNLVVMELVQVLSCVLCCCGIYKKDSQLIMAWFHLSSITFYVETFFQLLTCVEHYLAIVHPITYLRLREDRWIWIRNVIIGCIWLLSLTVSCAMINGNFYFTVDLFLMIVSVITISFCSLSVLQALIHPGPGDQGKDRVRIHQSKKRALYTIVAILAVLLLRCIYVLFWSLHSMFNDSIMECELSLGAILIYLPGSLVIPLLYLHRRRILVCQSHNRK